MTPGLLPTGLITVGVGVLFIVIQLNSIRKTFRVRRWPATKATINDISYTEDVADDIDTFTMAPLQRSVTRQTVTCSYTVDGVELPVTDIDSASLIEKVDGEFDVGARFDVFYNPSDPGFHVTDRSFDAAFLLGPILVAIGALISILATIFPEVGY